MFTRQAFNLAHTAYFVRSSFSRYRPLKTVPPEPYLQVPEGQQKQFNPADYPQWNIKHYKQVKNTYKRGLTEEPKPVVAGLGPIRVPNPKVQQKKYRWCSCGMSSKQPFCDDSHEGTLFKPLRFTVEQKTDYMELCACKHSKNKPFCDGETCKIIKEQQVQKPKEQLELKP